MVLHSSSSISISSTLQAASATTSGHQHLKHIKLFQQVIKPWTVYGRQVLLSKYPSRTLLSPAIAKACFRLNCFRPATAEGQGWKRKSLSFCLGSYFPADWLFWACLALDKLFKGQI